MTSPQPQDWLSAYARIQRLSDRDILRLLQQATSDITAQINKIVRTGKGQIGATVREYQLNQIRAAMLKKQAEIFAKLGNLTEARRLEAAYAAVSLNNKTIYDLFSAAGRPDLAVSIGEALNIGLATTIDVAVARMTQSKITLSERIYNTNVWMNGRVEKMIESALARGLSAKEFAAEAIDWFRPNTPGGVRYASMRLARTEINNAFHAMSVNAADAPWVHGMKWHLSSSHPKPDICDQYARNDPDNLGEGVYKVRNVPRKPHPHCFCYVTPVVEEEDAFLDALVGGKYDDHIDSVLAAGRSLPPLPKQATPSIVANASEVLQTGRISATQSVGKVIPQGTTVKANVWGLGDPVQVTSITKSKGVSGNVHITITHENGSTIVSPNTKLEFQVPTKKKRS